MKDKCIKHFQNSTLLKFFIFSYFIKKKKKKERLSSSIIRASRRSNNYTKYIYIFINFIYFFLKKVYMDSVKVWSRRNRNFVKLLLNGEYLSLQEISYRNGCILRQGFLKNIRTNLKYKYSHIWYKNIKKRF